MGLSSSKQTTKTNQSQTNNEVMQSTATPVTPDWLLGPTQDYVNRVGQFGARDPQSLVAGPSALQQQAWQGAAGLGGGGGYADALAMAQGAGAGGPNLAGPASQLGPASGYTGQGYQAPTLGPSQGYSAASAGPASQAQAASLLDNLGSYMSPYTNDVVDATLADFDYGGQQQQARLAAQGAKSGAFGGSRFGIAEGQLAADLTRGRATTSANLRDAAFRTGAGLSATDAAARQAASMFNTGESNRFALDQAGRTDAASQFGANAGNQFALAQAGLAADASRYGADAANRSSEFNATNNNAFAQLQAQMNQQAGQFDASQRDTAQARALQAAQLMAGITGDQGADQRANLGLQGEMGAQQRAIEQQQRLAELAQLEAQGSLMGMTPYDILVGRSVNGTTNSSGTLQGTNVTKQSPSMFNQLLAAGNMVAGFI